MPPWDQRLEDRGRGRVGGRHDSTDQPDGFRDGQRAVFLILLKDAASPLVLVLVVDVFGGELVLHHLVLHQSHAGLFHRQLRQRNPRTSRSESSLAENQIDLFLGEGGELLLSRLHLGNQGLKIGGGDHGHDSIQLSV